MAFDIDINSLSEKSREFIESLKINDIEKYNNLTNNDVLWLEGQLDSIFTAQATTPVPGFSGTSGVVAFSSSCASSGLYKVVATSSKGGYSGGITAYDTSGNILISEVSSGSTITLAAATNYVFRVRDLNGDGSNGTGFNFTIEPATPTTTTTTGAPTTTSTTGAPTTTTTTTTTTSTTSTTTPSGFSANLTGYNCTSANDYLTWDSAWYGNPVTLTVPSVGGRIQLTSGSHTAVVTGGSSALLFSPCFYDTGASGCDIDIFSVLCCPAGSTGSGCTGCTAGSPSTLPTIGAPYDSYWLDPSTGTSQVYTITIT